MSDIPVDPTASYTVAADVIGAVGYQRIKLNVGVSGVASDDVGATNPLPVAVSGPVQISGTVTAGAGTTVISGTVSVSGPVQISGTVTAGAGTTVVSVTGTVQVSGAVSISAMPAISGTVQVSGPVAVSGAVSISAMPAISGTVQVSGPVAVSGAVSISAMPAVSGNVGITNIVPVTTQASVSVSGLPVWMNPTQGVTILGVQSVNTIAAGFSVNALVTGVVSVSVMPSIAISQSQTLGTIVTILGTQIVSVVQASAAPVWVTGTITAGAGTTVISGTVTVANPGGAATTTNPPSITEAGSPIWIIGGQGTTVNPVWISGTVTAGAGTTVVSVTGVVAVSGAVSISVMPAISGTVTILNGASVTIQQGVSVSMPAVSGVVASSVPATSNAFGMPVWIVGGQTSTGVGVQVGFSSAMVTTMHPTDTQTGLVVWCPDIDVTTGTPAAAATGQMVWVVNPNSVSVSVSAAAAPYIYQQPIVIRLPANAAVAPDTKIAFSVYYAGTNVVATTSWVVPSGKTLRIEYIQVFAKTSAVINFALLVVNAETATASMSVTSTAVWIAAMPYGITAVTAGYSAIALNRDVAALTSVGLLVVGGTTHSHVGGVVMGFLF